MPYLDINLGRIMTFGDILKFVEKCSHTIFLDLYQSY